MQPKGFRFFLLLALPGIHVAAVLHGNFDTLDVRKHGLTPVSRGAPLHPNRTRAAIPSGGVFTPPYPSEYEYKNNTDLFRAGLGCHLLIGPGSTRFHWQERK